MTEKYRNMVFDLGGVLLQWNPRKFVEEAGVPRDFLKVIGSPLWVAHDGGFLSRKEVVEKAPSFIDKVQFETFLNSLARAMEPIEEMHALFQEVKQAGYRIYILSNMPKEMHLELSSLHDFFEGADGAIFSYQVGSIKPMEEIYHALFSSYELNPQECFFIDDFELNIYAAKKLGMGGVVCKTPEQVRQAMVLEGLVTAGQ